MTFKKNIVALFLFFIFAFNFTGSAFAMNSMDHLQHDHNIELAFGENNELSALSEQELDNTEGEWWVVVRWVFTRVVIPIILEQCSSDSEGEGGSD
mgnify:CR=1 FL=1